MALLYSMLGKKRAFAEKKLMQIKDAGTALKTFIIKNNKI
jgi:hypothetical protein